MWITLIALIATTFTVLGVVSAVNAVMTSRTSQGAIAWSISLVTFPYVAVPAYWLLGRTRFRGYVSARRSGDTRVQAKLKDLMDGLDAYRIQPTEMPAPGLAAERLAELPFLGGNKLELLVDGDATFESITAGIDAAEEYILFQFFIVHDDEIGRQLKDHMIVKAKAGVKVYFTYDEIGCSRLPKAYLEELREAGAEVHAFNTRKGIRNHFQINFRNHRKVVVVDGKVAWVGGHNVGDEYLSRDPKIGYWRDTHMRVEGPAAVAFQVSFVEDWHWSTDRVLEGLRWVSTVPDGGDKVVLAIPTGPADPLDSASLMYHHAINSAKRRIWIASPYFVPDDAIVAALQLAGLRGVDVRIIIPDKPDHLLVFLAAFSYYDDASRTGVRFFRYTKGFPHQKVMLVDDEAVTIGTANFDNRSFRLNFEITGVVADRAFAGEVEKMLEQDLADSREMTSADVDEKAWWFKLAIRLARLTAPVQ